MDARMNPWKKSRLMFLMVCCFVLLTSPKARIRAEEPPLRFNHVSLSDDSFNPYQGEEISIFFHLSAPALVTLKIYDQYGNLVQTMKEGYQAQKGSNKLSWNGQDLQGAIVPDEAYSFIIEAEGSEGERAVYDPTREFGEKIEVANPRLHSPEGTYAYTLPFPCRVLIRLGMPAGGPLYRTLLNWRPRSSGFHEEAWDGWDESHSVYLLGKKEIVASYQAYTLPKNAIITEGNPKSLQEGEHTTLTRQRSSGEEKTKIAITSNCPAESRSPHVDPAFRVSRDIGVLFTAQSGIGEASSARVRYRTSASAGEYITRVAIPAEDEPFLSQEQYELLFFIDDRFIEEIEIGRASLPYDYTWNTSELAPGSHILTVNIIGLKDHLGTASVNITIEE